MHKAASLIALASVFIAAPIVGKSALPPGTGVLCMGGLLYFAEDVAATCHAGQHPDFQARLSAYTDRFDAYIARNMDGGEDALQSFKAGQGVGSGDAKYLCSGSPASFYEDVRTAKAEEIDAAIDELLAVDGPPIFGDCL